MDSKANAGPFRYDTYEELMTKYYEPQIVEPAASGETPTPDFHVPDLRLAQIVFLLRSGAFSRNDKIAQDIRQNIFQQSMLFLINASHWFLIDFCV